MNDAEFMLRVLAVFAFDNTEDLWWRIDGECAPITFFALCNDFFEWGTADLERITPEDLPMLEQAADDLRSFPWLSYAGELYCARKRKMRPQGAAYKHIPESLWPLFNACGPERDVNLFNPRQQPTSEVQP